MQPPGSVHLGPADNCRTIGRAHAIQHTDINQNTISGLILQMFPSLKQIESFPQKFLMESFGSPGQA